MLTINVSAKMRESDVDDLADEADEAMLSYMEKLRTKIEAAWTTKADQELHSTKEQYKKGMEVTVEGDKVVATLSGWIPVGVERGTEKGWSMKGPDFAGPKIIPITDANGGAVKFRTMSKDKPWNHPGFQNPKKLLEKIQEDMPGILDEVFGDTISRKTV